ncbi:MAG: lipopolysaccharide heptosyltransferase II [Elusimicrobia bacterium]|nr:lipopolysaccharide heptosyltransferase II [Elusimicrobiota bacterium]
MTADAIQPRIIVIRLSSLGDVALTVPVYRSLKAHWPGCRISVLVKPAFASVLEGHPSVDEVIPFTGLFDALRRIRRGGFTHLLDLHGTFRSRVLRALSGVPNQAAYRKDALARRLFVIAGWPTPRLSRHTLDRYLESLAAWGIRSSRRLTLGDARAAPLARPRPGAPGPGAPRDAGAQRVLVMQTAFLGDATLTVPLCRAVKSALPGCRVTVVTRPDCEELFRSSPWVNECWVDDKRSGGSLRRLALRLKRGRFDIALVPHRSLRSALAARLARIPERIGFSASPLSGLFFTRIIPFTWGMHDLERNLSLLLPLAPSLDGTEAAGDPVYLQPDPEAARAVEARLAGAGLGKGAPLVGLHPGSVWATKRWPLERYAALAARLMREDGARVALIGGPGDAALCAQVARRAEGALDLSGSTSLAELIALMPRLSLFVTNDSGPMHIATASGVPTLAFFGPTTRELGFFPYGPKHRVLEKDLNCRPCGLHGSRACPHGHFLCMKLISIEEALANAREMMGSPGPLPASRERETERQVGA